MQNMSASWSAPADLAVIADRDGPNRAMLRMMERQRQQKVAAAAAYLLVLTRRDLKKGTRGRLRIRQRMDWSIRVGHLDEMEFVRRYRLTKRQFSGVCARIRADIEPNAAHSRSGSRGSVPINTEIQLSAVLRYCAGGAYQDIVDLHGISNPSFRQCIKKVSCLHPTHTLTSRVMSTGAAGNVQALPNGFRPQ